MTQRLWSVFLMLLCSLPLLGAQTDYAQTVASLIDPAKLATLGPRGANSRVQKIVCWLEMARKDKQEPRKVIDKALLLPGYRDKAAAKLTRKALERNLGIARKFGCLEPAGLEEMRRGRAATIRRGPNKGDELSVDHIIPRDVAPELDNCIANLELMPMRKNKSKNDTVGKEQLDYAKTLHAAGLLSKAGLKAVTRAYQAR